MSERTVRSSRCAVRSGLWSRLTLILAVLLFAAFGCEAQKAEESGGEKEQTTTAGEEAGAEGGGDEAGQATGDETAGDEAGGDDQAAGDETAGDEAAPGDDTAAVDDTAGDAGEPAGGTGAAVVALPTGSAGGDNPYLAMVPADTLYAWGTVRTMTMDQMPYDVADFVPMYEAAAKQMLDDPDSKAIGELLMELSTVFKAEGIEGFGIKDGGHSMLYGVGIWPVLRMQLSDGKKFEALVGRVVEKTGVESETATFGTTSYRKFDIEGMTVAAAIMDNEAVVALSAPETLDWVLGYAIGDQKPAATLGSLPNNKFAALAGRAPANSGGLSAGFVDFVGLHKTLTGENKNMAAESLAAMGVTLPLLEGACKDEFGALAAAAPQLVYTGYYGGANNMVANLTLDIDDEAFRSELAKVRGMAPGLGGPAPAESIGFIGLGVKVKDAVDFILSQASRVETKPFACPQLTAINDLAADAKRGLSAGVPPFLLEVTGAYVVVDDFQLDANSGMPQNINAVATIGTTQPDELWLAAGAISQDLAKVQLTTEPTKLPPIKGAEFLGDLYALKSGNALAIAINQKETAQAKSLLTASTVAPGATAPLLVVGYNQSKIAKILPPEVMNQPGTMEMMSSLGGFGMTSYGVSIVDEGFQVNIIQHLQPKAGGAATAPGTPTPDDTAKTDDGATDDGATDDGATDETE